MCWNNNGQKGKSLRNWHFIELNPHRHQVPVQEKKIISWPKKTHTHMLFFLRGPFNRNAQNEAMMNIGHSMSPCLGLSEFGICWQNKKWRINTLMLFMCYICTFVLQNITNAYPFNSRHIEHTMNHNFCCHKYYYILICDVFRFWNWKFGVDVSRLTILLWLLSIWFIHHITHRHHTCPTVFASCVDCRSKSLEGRAHKSFSEECININIYQNPVRFHSFGWHFKSPVLYLFIWCGHKSVQLPRENMAILIVNTLTMVCTYNSDDKKFGHERKGMPLFGGYDTWHTHTSVYSKQNSIVKN